MKTLSIIAALFFAFASCKKPYDGLGETEKQSIKVDGIDRTYYVYTPENYSPEKNYPVIFALHGRLGLAKKTDKFTNFNPVADEKGYIIVYPQGYSRSWNDNRNSGPAAEKGIDDIKFFDLLIDQVSSNYPIDLQKVYAAGMSNGGFMSISLACDLPNRFAAVASVTGTMAPSPNDYCVPEKAIPILFIAGVEDPIVPYNGGVIAGNEESEIIGFIEAFDFWANNNQCNGSIEKEEWADLKDDGTTVTVSKYTNCNKNKEVILYDVHGGGHTWPGGQQYLAEKRIGKVSFEFQAEREIVRFFQKHQLD